MNTKITDIINKDCLVYSILGDFSDENKKIIAKIQKEVNEKFDGLIWETPAEALHITLLVWINSWIGNTGNEDQEFETLFPKYDEILKKILSKHVPIEINFNQIKATEDAIIILGRDNGKFQEIRNEFVAETSLNEKINQPQIIHATIARFQKQQNLEDLNAFLEKLSFEFIETIERFKLPRETKKPMMEFEIKKYYELANKILIAN